MKKWILPMLAMFAMLVGCTERPHIITSNYTVTPDQWEQSITTYDNGTYDVNYYYSSWENVDITPDVIEFGVVLAYYIDDDNRDNMLPYTIYLKDDAGAFWQERIEFDIERGVITFKIKDTDFNTAQSMANIGTMKFKVSVIRDY